MLNDDTVLLEYSLGEKRSFVFVLDQQSIRVVQLAGQARIEQAARRMHRSVAAYGDSTLQGMNTLEDAVQQAVFNLSRLVLSPIPSDWLRKRILVVPDGALEYVPFTALVRPAARGLAVGAPLVSAHEVVNLPSASSVAALRDRKTPETAFSGAVAVLADPVFELNDSRLRTRPEKTQKATEVQRREAGLVSLSDGTPPLTRSAVDFGLARNMNINLRRLPGTRREAREILSLSLRSKAALDFDASRATAMSPELSRYGIVHFATHGLLNSQHPELSGLVFSLVDKNGNAQNGFLQLQDIYNMNLPADLVVLSACETGLGKEISGEGLVGLTRGFMYAGASRVVASLWKVSDAATAELMQRFYRGMLQEHLSPPAALRQAQISMWKQKRWHSPYFWAAFQIQGDWN
jgi:CHAT domain-containing protein